MNISEMERDRAILPVPRGKISIFTLPSLYIRITITIFATFGGHLQFEKEIKKFVLNISKTVRDRAILLRYNSLPFWN